ncbi:hypothetical protein [Emticicia sp. W12TSBA100-4]|uniref:hypothetical protein n=1 Tax=Emticicia sp. W12TSBA100-4 TaxID=3160965 RepID=UPI00330661B0
MEKKTKGRPAKPTAKRKRLHYSVWVSAEEKKQIDALIAQSNLPGSQFFLTQVIEKPIQRPKKKSLPKSVIEQISTLEKLSGLLALSVLKTKDKAMIAENWQQSSQNVKWITNLIVLKIFEDFDFPNLRDKLCRIKDDAQLLYWQLELNSKTEEQNELLSFSSRLHYNSKELLESFEKHYQSQAEPLRFQKLWIEEMDIHKEIENIKSDLLKR